MCCVCGGGIATEVKTQRNFMITTIDVEPAIDDIVAKLKKPPELDPKPKAKHSVPAGSEFSLFLGRLVTFTANEVEITVENENANFLEYEVRSNTLEILQDATDSNDIGHYQIKIKLLDSVDSLETEYSFTLLIVEPEPSELECSDTEVICAIEIDENGEETETCQCSEET